MKRFMLLFSVVGLLFLSGCMKVTSMEEYKGIEISGHKIYFNKFHKQVNCEASFPMVLFEDEDNIWRFWGVTGGLGCPSNLYVKQKDDYITINEAIQQEIISKEDFLETQFEFEIFAMNKLNINKENILKAEISYYEDSIIIQDIEEIESLVDIINGLGFSEDNSIDYEDGYNKGYLKLYVDEDNFLYFELSGGVIHNNLYTMPDFTGHLYDEIDDLLGR